MNLKKWAACAVALAMVFALAGCGGSNASGTFTGTVTAVDGNTVTMMAFDMEAMGGWGDGSRSDMGGTPEGEMPEGFDPGNMPGGGPPEGEMPEDFDPGNVPEGEPPEGGFGGMEGGEEQTFTVGGSTVYTLGGMEGQTSASLADVTAGAMVTVEVEKGVATRVTIMQMGGFGGAGGGPGGNMPGGEAPEGEAPEGEAETL